MTGGLWAEVVNLAYWARALCSGARRPRTTWERHLFEPLSAEERADSHSRRLQDVARHTPVPAQLVGRNAFDLGAFEEAMG